MHDYLLEESNFNKFDKTYDYSLNSNKETP